MGVWTWDGTAGAMTERVAGTPVGVPETPAELDAVMVLNRWARKGADAGGCAW